MSEKQDRQGVRTAADIERKYNFGQSFAEVLGIATDARLTAEEAKKETEKAVSKLTPDEIFALLTDNGKKQGIYKDPNGEIYINAEFIKSIEKLFAKDISMTGKFTNTVEVFLEPGQAELDTLQADLLSGNTLITGELIPLYDFNNDGAITVSDLATVRQVILGKYSLANWSGAKKSTVTLTIDLATPEKFLRIQGKNMWGRDVDEYIGINGSSINYSADRLIEYSESDIWTCEKWESGKAKCSGTLEITVDIATTFGNMYVTNNDIYANYPSGFFKETPKCVYSIESKIAVLCSAQSTDHSAIRTPKMYVFRPTSQSNVSVKIHFEATGRWK